MSSIFFPYGYSILDICFLVGILIGGFVFGAICQSIGSNKGRKGCFWWGFFLGFIGLIVVLCLSDSSKRYSYEKDKYESLEKLEQLKEKGTISKEEFEVEKKKLLK